MTKNEIKPISNSALSQVKRILLGIPEPVWPTGGNIAFDIGSEVHSRFLEGKKTKHFGEDEEPIVRMVTRLEKTPEITSLMDGAIFETIFENQIHFVPCKGIVDMINQKKKIIIDLKTTSATSFAQFVESCKKYDYFRQAYFYMKLTGVETVIFTGIQKTSPHKLYLINVLEFPREMFTAMNETKFLLHFYKYHYENLKPFRENDKYQDAIRQKSTGPH